MNVEDLIKRSMYVFGKHDIMLPLWQEIADNFYVERADFTNKRSPSEDFASHLSSSYPLLIRRDFGDQISSIVRPTGEEWMAVSIERDENLSVEAKRELQRMTKVQFRAMYDRNSGFVRATKECDHDYSAFGQGVITPEINWRDQVISYRCWHLRDFAWMDDINGKPCETHLKWRPTVFDLNQRYPTKITPRMREKLEKEPYCELECRTIVMPAELYLDRKEVRNKFVRITIEMEEKTVLEIVQRPNIGAVIPRWKTVSGSQFAYSPATVIALPDARLIQAMTLSMLEAGEMAVRPPLIAASDSIREDIQWFAGGITKADVDNDRQLKDVLAPIFQDKSGYQFGLELSRDTRDLISKAFYINRLTLPPADREMTAYETSQRVQEYIRQALPLFEPLEDDYNGQLCDQTFELLMQVGAFGNPRDFPRELQGSGIKFKFFNPLQEARDAKKVGKWRETIALTAESMQIDPNLVGVLKPEVALRDALEGGGTPEEWLSTEDEMEAFIAEKKMQAQQMQQLAQAGAVAEVAETAGRAAQEIEAVE